MQVVGEPGWYHELAPLVPWRRMGVRRISWKATAMPPARYYVTTSIPYVNARPHLGHALEFVQADLLARYHRLRGDDTYLLTGTDDNALKNVQAAEAAGMPVQQFVDANAAQFAALRLPLALSTDDFIRTSSERRHRAGVEKLWRACARAGDIDRRTYRGLYCLGCEQFYTPDELEDGLCPIHRRLPEVVDEENYFFRLTRYATPLRTAIETGALRILPETRRAEVLRFIDRGLHDFSISRSRERAHGWGISVPDDPGQVIYVWFDALANYVTALDYGADGHRYHHYWLTNPQRVHVIGKDILRFHAIYWPAMLLSAGEPLPTTIYVHEFLTVGGQKLSKSLGNVIDPTAMTAAYGTDALRYWLLREMPRTEDGDFTIERLVARYNQELANDLGNLMQRTISMLWRYRAGQLPAPGPSQSIDTTLMAVAAGLPELLAGAIDQFDFRSALEAIGALVTRANQYVEATAPWRLARQESTDTEASRRLDTVLYTLAETLRLLAVHLSPFLPTAAATMSQDLGQTDTAPQRFSKVTAWGQLTPGSMVAPARPIFPRIEERPPDVVATGEAPVDA